MSDILIHETHGIDDGLVIIFFSVGRFLGSGVNRKAYSRGREIIVVVVITRITRTGRFSSRRGRERNCTLTTGSMHGTRGQ